jgi:uracil-DNA glycosylase
MSALQQPLDRAFERLPAGWAELVQRWRLTEGARALVEHVDARVRSGALVYPAEVLHALELTPLDAVRCVIVGQDPYHGPGQAHGLSFSVPEGVRTPPSLRNIFAELQREFGRAPPSTDLSGWARQGVLLLNTTLTVEDGQAASHANKGWEGLTERLLLAVAERARPCVYLLWGAHAQRFEPLLLAKASTPADTLVLKSNHPSPLSARRPPVPFLGNGHFGQANQFLASRGGPIAWV